MKPISYSKLLNPITYFLFIPVFVLLLILSRKIEQAGLDPFVLMAGNIILYIITAFALYFHRKGSLNDNSHAFFRSVYASMLVRMFACILAVLIYAIAAGSRLNKYSLLLCFLFYFMYSFAEVRRVLLLLKKPA